MEPKTELSGNDYTDIKADFPPITIEQMAAEHRTFAASCEGVIDVEVLPDVQDMNTDALRLEIAEHLGWEYIRRIDDVEFWKSQTFEAFQFAESTIPRYATDANACYELERYIYSQHLRILQHSDPYEIQQSKFVVKIYDPVHGADFEGEDERCRLVAFCRAAVLAFRAGIVESKKQ